MIGFSSSILHIDNLSVDLKCPIAEVLSLTDRLIVRFDDYQKIDNVVCVGLDGKILWTIEPLMPSEKAPQIPIEGNYVVALKLDKKGILHVVDFHAFERIIDLQSGKTLQKIPLPSFC